MPKHGTYLTESHLKNQPDPHLKKAMQIIDRASYEPDQGAHDIFIDRANILAIPFIALDGEPPIEEYRNFLKACVRSGENLEMNMKMFPYPRTPYWRNPTCKQIVDELLRLYQLNTTVNLRLITEYPEQGTIVAKAAEYVGQLAFAQNEN